MNPIGIKDITDYSDYLVNPDYLICASFDTHNAIHYGNEDILHKYDFAVRTPNDMAPWRKYT